MGVLGVLTVVMLTTLLVLVGVALVVRRQLRRSNRVAADIRGQAPVIWLWSPTRPGRLHRRLHQAVAPIDPAATHEHLPPAPATDRLRDELTHEAVSVDDWLVWTSKLRGRSRRDHLTEISTQVTTIEALAGRLLGWTPGAPDTTAGPRLAGLAEQIDHLAAAREELRSTIEVLDPAQIDALDFNGSPATQVSQQ